MRRPENRSTEEATSSSADRTGPRRSRRRAGENASCPACFRPSAHIPRMTPRHAANVNVRQARLRYTSSFFACSTVRCRASSRMRSDLLGRSVSELAPTLAQRAQLAHACGHRRAAASPAVDSALLVANRLGHGALPGFPKARARHRRSALRRPCASSARRRSGCARHHRECRKPCGPLAVEGRAAVIPCSGERAWQPPPRAGHGAEDSGRGRRDGLVVTPRPQALGSTA